MTTGTRIQISWSLTSLSRIADELQDLAVRTKGPIAFTAKAGVIIAPVNVGKIVAPGQRKSAIINDLVASIHGDIACT